MTHLLLASALVLPFVACSTAPAVSGPETGSATNKLSAASCNATSAAEHARLVFATRLDCDGTSRASCPLAPLTLRARGDSSAPNDVTVSWNIMRGDELVLARSSSVSAARTATELAFGPAFGGEHHAVLVADGNMLTGSIDDQPIAPSKLENGTVQDLQLVDRAALPTIRTDDATRSAIYRLLDKARSEAPSTCAGSDSGALAHVMDALRTALPQSGFSQAARSAPLRAANGPEHSQPTEIRPSSGQVAVTSAALSPGGSAPQGVDLDFSGSTDSNSLIEYATPACQQCEHDCATNYLLDALSFGGYALACQYGCFFPGNGCSQNSCSLLDGVTGSCDDNQQCCGSLCCGPGTVCGNADLGACCPASHPVACGDATKVTCFVAGSQCCANMPNACPPGQACTLVDGAPSCCPPSQSAADGTCCQRETCSGQCCDQGSCDSAGTCCLGPVVNGVCCPGGLAATLCGGACCMGTCTSSGVCCDGSAGSLACGSVCCAAGEACLDASSSLCGLPSQPVLQLIAGDGTVRTQSGSDSPVVIYDQEFTVRGLSYDPGVVTLSVDTVSGPVIATAVAQGGAGAAGFTLTASRAPLSIGSHHIVAWQSARGTILQAEIAVAIIPPVR